MMIQTNVLRRDGGTQMRETLNEDHARSLKDARERGVVLPPIRVMHDGTNYWPVDGFHRIKAAQLLGQSVIEAEVEPGTREQAIEAAAGSNAAHGLPRSNEAKRNSVRALLGLEKWKKMSAGAIAEHCGVSNMLVLDVLKRENPELAEERQQTPLVGRDGVAQRTGAIGRRPIAQRQQEPEEDREPVASPGPTTSSRSGSIGSFAPDSQDEEQQSASVPSPSGRMGFGRSAGRFGVSLDDLREAAEEACRAYDAEALRTGAEPFTWPRRPKCAP